MISSSCTMDSKDAKYFYGGCEGDCTNCSEFEEPYDCSDAAKCEGCDDYYPIVTMIFDGEEDCFYCEDCGEDMR